MTLPRYLAIKEGYHWVVFDTTTGQTKARWFPTLRSALAFIATLKP